VQRIVDSKIFILSTLLCIFSSFADAELNVRCPEIMF